MTQQPLNTINPLAPDVLACPYAFNQQLREQAPVYHCPITDIYFISDYDNVVDIAKNEKRFSNEFSMIRTGNEQPVIPGLEAILKKRISPSRYHAYGGSTPSKTLPLAVPETLFC